MAVALALTLIMQTNLTRVYMPLIHIYNQLKQLNICNKMIHFSYKGLCGVHGHRTRIDVFKRRIDLGYR